MTAVQVRQALHGLTVFRPSDASAVKFLLNSLFARLLPGQQQVSGSTLLIPSCKAQQACLQQVLLWRVRMHHWNVKHSV